ncbi:DedA family protein [Gluconobacter japonicus]|uniref:DedA family protein n=1 Tax=Gluconobacter japonicus TaxID=376620 RepID=UPI000B0BC098|nr:DedA family protein [Gluconobacter japonicus]
MLESMGLPLPAESIIIAASLYAGSTHHLHIEWIALAAVTGAIMGDNFGYLLGHHFGYSILKKHGKKVGLTEERLMLGRYLFRKHGGIVVFLGRFVAILRVFVALLAGANRMPWHSFLFFNALGGLFWAGGYAFITYELGKQIEKITGPVGIGLAAIGVCCLIGAFLFLKKNEKRLTDEAMKQAEEEEKHSYSNAKDKGKHE